MTTVIFIHGISVREPQFSQTFKHIKAEFQNRLPQLRVIPCSWGDALGAKLNAHGASIPLYDTTRNSQDVPEKDENILRWNQLYQDSLYELRLLSLNTKEDDDFNPNQEEAGEKIDEKVKELNPSDELQGKLKEGGIFDVFDLAYQNVISSTPYREALETASDDNLTEYRNAIARAIVAEAIGISQTKNLYPLISIDADLRDEIIECLSSEIMDSERGVGDWLTQQVFRLSTYELRKNRGFVSDVTTPVVGDIVLYQGRGQKIRDLIHNYIKEAESPVVLLAHSLGGIACVDLLVKKQLNQVKLLITVGSQAPYFYEINALHSLEFGKTLPEYFPQWLNIYDRNDFLSFIGGGVFADRVQDILVDNKQPFPNSHGAYWTNKATWKAIVERIKKI